MATSVFFMTKKFHMCGMELCDREKDLIIARRGAGIIVRKIKRPSYILVESLIKFS